MYLYATYGNRIAKLASDLAMLKLVVGRVDRHHLGGQRALYVR